MGESAREGGLLLPAAALLSSGTVWPRLGGLNLRQSLRPPFEFDSEGVCVLFVCPEEFFCEPESGEDCATVFCDSLPEKVCESSAVAALPSGRRPNVRQPSRVPTAGLEASLPEGAFVSAVSEAFRPLFPAGLAPRPLPTWLFC